MSFPRYAEYKDSGVQWLGEVPAHWDVVRLKHVVASIGSGTSVNSTDTPAADGERGVLKTSCVYSGEFDEAENKAVVPDEYDRVSCPLKEGTLIVSRMNTPELVGAAGLVRYGRDGLFLPDRLWQISFSGSKASYAHFWTQTDSYRCQVNMACSGTSSSMQNLSQDQLRCFDFPLPSLGEQAAITAFLDRQTAKIDALVAEQERLIALLAEKRQAAISHAVTKGVNPAAPMKDSGIEWLGDVPEHWKIAALKRLIEYGTSISYGIVQPGEPLDEGVPFVQTTNMTTGSFSISDLQKTSYEISATYPRSRLSGGEVILGIRASIGAAHVVPEHLKGCNLSRGVARICCNGSLSSRFLVAYLGSFPVENYWQLAKQGSTFNEVSIETVTELRVPIPPLDEQAAIVSTIDNAQREFNRLIAESERAIDLLKERRSALISAAVTGKIDVRGMVEADAA